MGVIVAKGRDAESAVEPTAVKAVISDQFLQDKPGSTGGGLVITPVPQNLEALGQGCQQQAIPGDDDLLIPVRRHPLGPYLAQGLQALLQNLVNFYSADGEFRR